MITDPRDPELVYGEVGGPLLRQFNQAGVLAPADVHAAIRLGRIGGETDDEVLLAAALAVRAPRVGNVSADLATLREVAVAGAEEEADLDLLAWPSPGDWIRRVGHSPLVGGEDGQVERPLRLSGTHLYLDRYWRDELAVAAHVLARIGAPSPEPLDQPALKAGLDRLLGGERAADQRRAAEAVLRGRFTVIAGGPGTGKTTTVARILALLFEQATARPPLVALAAPTGKAAARLEEAVRAEAAAMDVSPETRRWLAAARGSTVHRLLGSRPGTSSSFRHDRYHRLPHDVVVVDEASMMSLALMARLLEAVRSDARLVLVGDPEQLVSVEAGAVLADIVGPAGSPAGSGPAGSGLAAPAIASSIVRLTTNHRFSGALAELAGAVRTGDADTVLEVLGGSDPAVSWVRDSGEGGAELRDEIAGWAGTVVAAARRGDGAAALEALRLNRVLCAHRDGPTGAITWNQRIERWLGEAWPGLDSEGPWYSGRAALVTANDYGLQLFNGDTGVAVAGPDSTVMVAFDGAGTPAPPRLIGPSRLAAVETVFAMTVHKSQGSEFDQVTLVLPSPESRLLTRELLYTALTRARRRVVVVGGEEAVRAGVARPVARASGLAARLWTS